MKNMSLDQITLLIELYRHDQEYVKYLVWCMIDQLEMRAIEQSSSMASPMISEDTLKKSMMIAIESTADEMERKSLAEFFVNQE
jgi:hypothetical protein